MRLRLFQTLAQDARLFEEKLFKLPRLRVRLAERHLKFLLRLSVGTVGLHDLPKLGVFLGIGRKIGGQVGIGGGKRLRQRIIAPCDLFKPPEHQKPIFTTRSTPARSLTTIAKSQRVSC